MPTRFITKYQPKVGGDTLALVAVGFPENPLDAIPGYRSASSPPHYKSQFSGIFLNSQVIYRYAFLRNRLTVFEHLGKLTPALQSLVPGNSVFAPLAWGSGAHTVRRFLPFLLRRLRVSIPPALFILLRNPCRLLFLTLCG